MSVEDFRKKETQMERELNRKEKEKDDQVKGQLENMTPKILYNVTRSGYLGIRVSYTRASRDRHETAEAKEQFRREQQAVKVVYQRESDIPKSPIEAFSKSVVSSVRDIMTIPFFKPGSYPPKMIRVSEHSISMQDDFFKVIRPPPPPDPMMSMYPRMMHHPMQNSGQGPLPGSMGHGMSGGMPGAPNGMLGVGMSGGMPGGMPGGMSGGMQGGMPGGMPGGMQGGMQGGMPLGMSGSMQGGMSGGMPSGMPGGILNSMGNPMGPLSQLSGSMPSLFGQPSQQPPPPPRVSPLPSAPIPAYNGIMPGNMPMYDPNMIMNPMDPYNFMGKSKILYNPVTKKPQNYRTVPCRRFHSTDGCERGDNCHFIHDFQYQGRPIPNFQAWKNNNMQKSMQMHSFPNAPGYYPPGGHENYDGRN